MSDWDEEDSHRRAHEWNDELRDRLRRQDYTDKEIERVLSPLDKSQRKTSSE